MARILDLCDGIVSLIRANWQPTSPDAVSREYAPEIPLVGSEGVTLLTGRKVYVFPAVYGTQGLETRGEYDRRYTVGVIVVERYTGTGQPPNSWVDARLSWTEANVFNVVRDVGLRLIGDGPNAGAWPDPEEFATVDGYSLDRLQQQQAFWSELVFHFRELETA